MTKTRIAVIVSLMFAAPATVVALGQSASLDATAPTVEIQATAPEISAEPAAPAESTVMVTETVVVAEVSAEPIPQASGRTHSAQPKGIMGWLKSSTAGSDTFPKANGPEDIDRPILPAQMAYFNRLEQDRSHLIAKGDAFPGAANEDRDPLPSVVAYFDRGEQQRFASAQPRLPVVASLDQSSSSKD